MQVAQGWHLPRYEALDGVLPLFLADDPGGVESFADLLNLVVLDRDVSLWGWRRLGFIEGIEIK